MLVASFMVSCLIGGIASRDDSQDEIDRLEKELEKVRKEQDEKISALSRSASRTAFNPAITGFLNFATRWDDKKAEIDVGGTPEEISNKLYFRSFELDLRSAVDPFSDAVAIVAIEQGAGGEFEVNPEEGYVVISKLPQIEKFPLGMQFKVGKFRPSIGVNNRLHLHDNLWVTRPRVISDFLGSESGNYFEAGLSALGAEVKAFLPEFSDNSTNELYLGVVNAGDIGLTFDKNAVKRAAPFARVNTFTQLDHTLDLTGGLNGYVQMGTLDARLWSVDLALRWRDPEKSAFRSLSVGGEYFSAERDFVDSVTGLNNENSPAGYYVYAQYQLDWNTYVGLRYDSVEDLDDDSESTQTVGAYITYYTTEFLRFRLGYERATSDDGELDKTDTVMLELNIVFGTHPVEPYWVNR